MASEAGSADGGIVLDGVVFDFSGAAYDSIPAWKEARAAPPAPPADLTALLTVPLTGRDAAWRRQLSGTMVSFMTRYTAAHMSQDLDTSAIAAIFGPIPAPYTAYRLLIRLYFLEGLWLDEAVSGDYLPDVISDPPLTDLTSGNRSSIRPTASIVRAYTLIALLDSPHRDEFQALHTGQDPKAQRDMTLVTAIEHNQVWAAQYGKPAYDAELGAKMGIEHNIAGHPIPFVTSDLNEGCRYEIILYRSAGGIAVQPVPSFPYIDRDDLNLRVRGSGEHRFVYRALHTVEADHRLAVYKATVEAAAADKQKSLEALLDQQRREIALLQRRNAGALPSSLPTPAPVVSLGFATSLPPGANTFTSAAELLRHTPQPAAGPSGFGVSAPATAAPPSPGMGAYPMPMPTAAQHAGPSFADVNTVRGAAVSSATQPLLFGVQPAPTQAAPASVQPHHAVQVPLPKMPMFGEYKGEMGTPAQQWIDEVQRFWAFNLHAHPGHEVTFTLSRLKGDALQWFNSTLGVKYSLSGLGCPAQEFISTFKQRFITPHVQLHARAALQKLNQGATTVIQYNEKFNAAIEAIKQLPGDDGLSASSTVAEYLRGLSKRTRERLSLAYPNMQSGPLPALQAVAAANEQALLVAESFTAKKPEDDKEESMKVTPASRRARKQQKKQSNQGSQSQSNTNTNKTGTAAQGSGGLRTIAWPALPAGTALDNSPPTSSGYRLPKPLYLLLSPADRNAVRAKKCVLDIPNNVRAAWDRIEASQEGSAQQTQRSQGGSGQHRPSKQRRLNNSVAAAVSDFMQQAFQQSAPQQSAAPFQQPAAPFQPMAPPPQHSYPGGWGPPPGFGPGPPRSGWVSDSSPVNCMPHAVAPDVSMFNTQDGMADYASSAVNEPQELPGPLKMTVSAAATPGMEDCDTDALKMLFSVYAERQSGTPGRRKQHVKLTCLIDSGSSHSFVSSRFSHCAAAPTASGTVHMANGAQQRIDIAAAKLRLGSLSFKHPVGIMPMGSVFDMVLGQDWLDKYNGTLSYDRQDPNMQGIDKRGIYYRDPACPAKQMWCPLPDKFKCAALNSVVANTAAYIRSQHAKGVHGDADHAFMVYLSDVLPEQDFMPSVTAATHDNTMPHHVSDSDLHVETQTLRADIANLVSEFSDRFPADIPAGLPPEREGVAHAIPLKSPDMQPPFRKFYRMTQEEKREVEEKLRDLLDKDWIQPSHSPYGAPIMFVAKKDGGLRMVVDYRALNKQTVKNRYPLPRIDDLLDCLQGAQFFSALDLQQAYHQVRLKPEDVPKTAFITHKGQYEYRVLSFGLSNAPATFQALMNRVLSPFLGVFCLVYMDDVLIFSKSADDHVQHLRQVLAAFRQHTLYCKLSKCRFAMTEVPFLGNIITRDGLKPNPIKVKILVDWPIPQSPHDLKCFLGLAQYFAKYMNGYATLAACLQALLRKNAQWHWSEACDSAFNSIKQLLTTAPVLALPDPTRPFEVVTDACQTGIGAVLLQDGRPVAFTGRLLSPAEQRYSTTDQELLAVIYAVAQWRCYLQGALHDFTLVTDHHPNTYFATQPNLTRRQARWSEKLQEYNFQWQYRPGRHNVADPVSRSPGLQSEVTAALYGLSFGWHPRPHVLHEGLADAMACEPAVRFLSSMTYSSHGVSAAVATRSQTQDASQPDQSPPSQPAQAHVPAPAPSAPVQPSVYGEHDADKLSVLHEIQQAYLLDPVFGDPNDPAVHHKHLTARNGLWYRHGVIAVPNSPHIKRQILSELHDSGYAGHGGEYKTVQLVRRYFWWPSLDNECRAFVKGCVHCQRNKASTRKYAGLLQQHDVAVSPWEQVSMDFITHLPVTAQQYDSIMVVVDTLTKMTHFIPCKMTDTAEDTAWRYCRDVFRLHGWPKVLITDRDTRFTDAFFRALCAQLGTRQAMSTAHHPETDGQTERMNRVLEETLRHFVNDRMDNWDVLLPAAEFAVNNSHQQSIGTTPFHVNYGYHPRVPLDVGVSPNDGVNHFLQPMHDMMLDAGRYLSFAQQRMHADGIAALVASARQHLVTARNKQAQYANARRVQLSFNKGDQVMLRTKNLSLKHWPAKKLFPLWLGPFEVESRLGHVAYRLVLPSYWRIHNVFHVNLLKPYRHNGQDHPPSPFTYIAGQPYEYEVDHIIDHKPKELVLHKNSPPVPVVIQPGLPLKVLRQLQFKVRWLYATPEHDSWEPFENLRNAPESLAAYGL